MIIAKGTLSIYAQDCVHIRFAFSANITKVYIISCICVLSVKVVEQHSFFPPLLCCNRVNSVTRSPKCVLWTMEDSTIKQYAGVTRLVYNVSFKSFGCYFIYKKPATIRFRNRLSIGFLRLFLWLYLDLPTYWQKLEFYLVKIVKFLEWPSK